MKTNKKAQSQIITTVLIILLVLAAIVIVWQVVRGTIGETTEQIGGATSCINVELEIEEYSGTQSCSLPGVPVVNCPGLDGTIIQPYVSIKRGSQGGDIGGIRILVDGNKVDANIANDGHQDFTPLKVLESITYIFFGEVSVSPAIEKVEVAAVLLDGTVCPVADTYEVA